MSYVDRDDLDSFKHEAVWKTLQKFDAGRGRKFVNMLANKLRWILLTNERTKFRQRRLHRKIADEMGDQDFSPDLGGYLDGMSIHDELAAQLSDGEKRLVDLRLGRGLSFRRIADELGVSHGTAVSMYDKTIVKLRKYADKSHFGRFHD